MRRFQSFLLSAVAAIGFASVASAADMPTKASIVKAPVSVATTNWTGIWAGAGFGYGMGVINNSTASAGGAPFDIGHDNGAKGWLGTIAIGADYQFSPNWLGGVFADFDWSGIKGQYSFSCPSGCAGAGGYVGETKQNRVWAVGGRVGYLVTPRLLTYVTGGFTQTNFTGVNFVDISSGAPDALTLGSRRYNGYFTGGGTEYAVDFLPGLFWKSEYRIADYGSQTLAQICGGAAPCGAAGTHSVNTSHPYVQTVRSEFVYRFNMGAAPAGTASVAPSVASWSGFWISGGVGYGMAALDHSALNAAATTVFDIGHDNGAKGFLGTVGIGADYQVLPRWVVGGFVDFDWSNIKGQYSFNCPGGCAGPFGFAGETKQDWAWAVGGRVGYVMSPQLLTFLSGGFTQANFTGVNFVDLSSGAVTGLTLGSRRYNGYFLGSGAEYAIGFLPGLFWKSEYRFADYGSSQTNAQNCGGGLCGPAGTIHSTDRSNHVYVQTVRSELVYRFNWSGLAAR